MRSHRLWLAVVVAIGGCGGSATGDDDDAGGDGDAGGTADASCLDGDGDGSTTCDGDCDDADATSYPGATEICGDGADNDCDGTADPASLCQGIGTFVSALTGNDTTGDGTQQAPVATIGQGMLNAAAIGGGADVYVAEGTYDAKVTLAEGVSLYGGYQCDTTTCTWARDPSAYVSVIMNNDIEGVLAGDSITRATVLDGFRVMGQSGDPGDTLGSAGITVAGGSPTVTGNEIYGGAVTGCANCWSSCVRVIGPPNAAAGPLVDGNRIHGGDSVLTTEGITLEWGGSAVAEITRNWVRGGNGRWSTTIGLWNTAAGTLVQGNRIHAGGSVGSGGQGGAWGIQVIGTATVDGNLVNGDPALRGTCTGNGGRWCGGIWLGGATAVVTNNVAHGMPAPRSAAVYLGESEIPTGDLIVNGNTLVGGGLANAIALSVSTAVVLGNVFSGTNVVAGKIRNNILDGGSATNRFAVFEDDKAAMTFHPVAMENNDVHFAAQVGATDNAYRAWPTNGPAVLHATVAALEAAVTFATSNLTGDPRLDSTWHLQSGSPCINAGTATEAPAADIDGDLRPLGGVIDVGADERE